MVLKEEQFAGYRNFPVLDANHDLKRLARAGNTQFNEEYLRLLEEDDVIEEQYKVILQYLITVEERLNPCKKKNDKDDVTEDKKRLEALKKQKALEGISKHDDDDAEEENDPQYELFVKHLKEHDKSCVLEYEKNGLPMVIKYEGDIASNKEASNAWIEKCSASEFRKAKSSRAYKNVERNNLEKEGNSKSYSDVEMFDEAPCVKEGMSNPFVSSKKISRSMEEDGIGRSNANEEFRERVLNVLKKPYDSEEYTRHLEAIQAGRYFDYYPDLLRKLNKYQYNRRKKLAILRGFFFWLQNLTQEGAFKPWKDRACLAVEPPSP